MLSIDDIQIIRSSVTEHWTAHVKVPDFVRIAAGKEIGHKIGDIVDEETTKLLKTTGRFSIKHQHKKGVPASRSMGDLWIESGGIYNPINIKAGEYGKNGQPNLVSLKRVLSALALSLIDSYYLLIMKIEHTGVDYCPHVYLVDMLDFLDYTVFNSGPGQLMLKEAQFYPTVESLNERGVNAPSPTRTIPEKISRLYRMLELADRQLYTDREKKRLQIREQVAEYSATKRPAVLRAAQEEYFNLG